MFFDSNTQYQYIISKFKKQTQLFLKAKVYKQIRTLASKDSN